MDDIRTILDEIGKYSEDQEYTKCINLCRKALLLTNKKAFDEWYQIRFMLSNFLREEGKKKPAYIEESIDILFDLLNMTDKKQYPKYWGKVNLGIGFAYNEINTDNKGKNIKSAIKYYKNALRVFSLKEHPEEWAATMAVLGYIYAIKETGNKQENIILGIKYIVASLQYYQKSKHPCQYRDKIKELYRLKLILKNNMLWYEIISNFVGWEEIERSVEEHNKNLSI